MKKRLISSIIGLIVLTILSSCNKDSSTDTPINQPFPSPVGVPISVLLHPESPGLTIPVNFQGLSIEVGKLTDPTYVNVQNTAFINLIKNLGDNGCLRFGGNSSDKLIYTGKIRQTNTGNDSLTTSDIDRVAAFVKATNWKVIFGLNLGINNPSLATKEAKYVSNALGSQLINFQFGNEPNDFPGGGLRNSPYNYSDYQADWNKYYTAVREALPNVFFAGPDITSNKKGQTFITGFAATQNSKANLLDGHYYVANHSSNSPLTTGTILAKDGALLSYLSVFQTAGKQNNLKYRISESNTISGGGTKGVSDVFASSLWALDYMWILAEQGSQGVNFHGSGTTSYSPIYFQNAQFTAQPEYYGLLAFKYGAVGSIIPVDITNSKNVNCTAHASFSNGVEYLTIVNKDTVNAAAITVTPNRTSTSVQVMRLSATSVNATAGVTFAGSAVNPDGTFQTATTENYSLSGKPNFIVNVPAGSATVVQIK